MVTWELVREPVDGLMNCKNNHRLLMDDTRSRRLAELEARPPTRANAHIEAAAGDSLIVDRYIDEMYKASAKLRRPARVAGKRSRKGRVCAGP